MNAMLVCLILSLFPVSGVAGEWDLQKIKEEVSLNQQALQASKSAMVQDYLKEAQHYYQVGDFDLSISAVRKGLYLDPQNQELLVLLGANLIKIGAYNDAEQVLEQLVSLYPGNYAGWKLLYRCYIKNSDLKGQRVALERLYVLSESREKKKVYFEKLVDLLGKQLGLDGECVILKRIYALAKNDGDRESYFRELTKGFQDLRSKGNKEGILSIIRGFIVAQLNTLCSITAEDKVSEDDVSKVANVLNMVEEVKRLVPDLRGYYADFIAELYDTIRLFNLGYKAIASERLRDLLSQKCPALSS